MLQLLPAPRVVVANIHQVPVQSKHTAAGVQWVENSASMYSAVHPLPFPAGLAARTDCEAAGQSFTAYNWVKYTNIDIHTKGPVLELLSV